MLFEIKAHGFTERVSGEYEGCILEASSVAKRLGAEVEIKEEFPGKMEEIGFVCRNGTFIKSIDAASEANKPPRRMTFY